MNEKHEKKGKALDVGKQTNKKQLRRVYTRGKLAMLKQWKARNENSAGKETKRSELGCVLNCATSLITCILMSQNWHSSLM